MFRVGMRRFTTSVHRAAETVAQIESAQAYAIGVSKAQGIAHDGFVTGTPYEESDTCPAVNNPLQPLEKLLSSV